MLGSVLIAGIVLGSAGSAPNVEAELVLPYRSVVAGDEFPVGIRLDIEKPWHIYWMNPGDTGIPTTIKWELPKGWTVSRLSFPTPHRYDDEGMVSYTHEGQVDFVAWVKAPAGARMGESVDIKAQVNWLACIDSCIPGSAKVEGSLVVGSQARLDVKASEKLAEMRSVQPKSWRGIYSISQMDDGDLIASFGGMETKEAFFFAESAEVVEPSAAQTVIESGPGGFGLRLKKSPYAQGKAERLRGVLRLKDTEGKEQSFWIDAPIRELKEGEHNRK